MLQIPQHSCTCVRWGQSARMDTWSNCILEMGEKKSHVNFAVLSYVGKYLCCVFKSKVSFCCLWSNLGKAIICSAMSNQCKPLVKPSTMSPIPDPLPHLDAKQVPWLRTCTCRWRVAPLEGGATPTLEVLPTHLCKLTQHSTCPPSPRLYHIFI